ncbi:MAG: hypothetical protein WBC80_20120 [Isosphaeraceae bacterium]|jgi:hypothetical protein
MEQGQSAMMRSLQTPKGPSGQLSEAYCYPAYAPMAMRPQASRIWHPLGRLTVGVVAAIWYLITLPFRLLIGIIGILGRLAGIILGFSLMVVGMALWAGPLFILGIPLFIIGLLLTLRCLA